MSLFPHEATHKSGGADAFTATDLLEALVKRLRESSGPSDLLVAGIADGEFLKRSGTSIIGSVGTGTAAGNQFDTTAVPTTPNQVIDIYGDGGANARGLTFDETTRDMIRLRVSFKVDTGNNFNLRVRLFKYDSGTATSILLASIAKKSPPTVTSDTYYVIEQLVTAGPNPTEKSIETGDAVYIVIDKDTGTVATGISQLSLTIVSKVV